MYEFGRFLLIFHAFGKFNIAKLYDLAMCNLQTINGNF